MIGSGLLLHITPDVRFEPFPKMSDIESQNSQESDIRINSQNSDNSVNNSDESFKNSTICNDLDYGHQFEDSNNKHIMHSQATNNNDMDRNDSEVVFTDDEMHFDGNDPSAEMGAIEQLLKIAGNIQKLFQEQEQNYQVL